MKPKVTLSKVVGAVMIGAIVSIGLLLFGNIAKRLAADDPPGPGVRAPGFELPVLNTERAQSLASLRGQVVLLEFWTSSCVGCIGATPKLNRLHKRFADQGFMVLGINTDGDQGAQAKGVVRDRAIIYPVLIDAGAVAQSYGIYATPTAVLVDAAGKIRHVHKGNVTETMLGKEIKNLLAESG